MEGNSKKRLRANWLDLVILLAVAAAAVFMFMRYAKSETNLPFTGSTQKIQMKIYTSDLRDEFAAAVKIGDEVRDRVTNAYFGRVVDIEIRPSEIPVNTSDGGIVIANKSGSSWICITIEGEGTYSANGATYNSNIYYINRQLEVRAGNVFFYGAVYDLALMD